MGGLTLSTEESNLAVFNIQSNASLTGVLTLIFKEIQITFLYFKFKSVPQVQLNLISQLQMEVQLLQSIQVRLLQEVTFIRLFQEI